MPIYTVTPSLSQRPAKTETSSAMVSLGGLAEDKAHRPQSASVGTVLP